MPSVAASTVAERRLRTTQTAFQAKDRLGAYWTGVTLQPPLGQLPMVHFAPGPHSITQCPAPPQVSMPQVVFAAQRRVQLPPAQSLILQPADEAWQSMLQPPPLQTARLQVPPFEQVMAQLEPHSV